LTLGHEEKLTKLGKQNGLRHFLETNESSLWCALPSPSVFLLLACIRVVFWKETANVTNNVYMHCRESATRRWRCHKSTRLG
jgi:hypothetical protein